MPSTLVQPEVVARAVLEKAPVGPPAPGSPQEAAAKIRERLAESPRSATESMRQQPIEQRRIDEFIDKNSGIERDARGIKKRPVGSETKNRFDQMQKYAKLGKDYLEKGYDGLDAAQKGEVRMFVERTVRAWPEAEAIFSGPPPMPAADTQAIIEEILRNPEFRTKARTIFESAIDPSKALQETAVIEARTGYEEAKRQEDEKKAEETKNNLEGTRVDDELRLFSVVGGIDGAKLAELKGLERDLPELTMDLATKRADLEEARDDIRYYSDRRRALISRGQDTTEIENTLREKQTATRTFQREITGIQDKINRKQVLEDEREELTRKKQEIDAKKSPLKEEIKVLTQDRLRAQADYASVQLTRTSQEQDFVDSLKNVFSETTMQYMEDKIAAAEQAQSQLIDEEKAKTTDPDEQKVLDALKQRWDFVEWKGGRQTFKINKNQTKYDYGNLIAEGPKRILRDILMANTGLTPGTPAYQTEIARIDAKLNDPDFIAKVQPKVVERVITRQVQCGKVTEDDVRILRESDWGQGTIQAAINSKKELKSEIEQLYGQGALEGGALWQRLKRMSNGSLLKFLLIIFGGIATVGVLPAGLALKGALKES